MTVALYPNFRKKNALSCAKAVCRILSDLEIRVYVESEYASAFSEFENVDFLDIKTAANLSDVVIAIGGDGTMLRCAKQLIGCDTGLLGINTGTLGFMASLEYEQLDMLSRLKNKEYYVSERMLLSCSVEDNGEKKEFIALNDICVSEQFSKICDFAVYSEDYLIGKYRADGVLFSTPTGSTAYSMSAGGPIIDPTMRSVCLTPICSHALSAKPILLNSDKVIKLKAFSKKRTEIYLSVDGRKVANIKPYTEIIVTASDKIVKLVRLNDRSFYKTLSFKFLDSRSGVYER